MILTLGFATGVDGTSSPVQIKGISFNNGKIADIVIDSTPA
jgi:hypothetical protein